MSFQPHLVVSKVSDALAPLAANSWTYFLSCSPIQLVERILAPTDQNHILPMGQKICVVFLCDWLVFMYLQVWSIRHTYYIRPHGLTNEAQDHRIGRRHCQGRQFSGKPLIKAQHVRPVVLSVQYEVTRFLQGWEGQRILPPMPLTPRVLPYTLSCHKLCDIVSGGVSNCATLSPLSEQLTCTSHWQLQAMRKRRMSHGTSWGLSHILPQPTIPSIPHNPSS